MILIFSSGETWMIISNEAALSKMRVKGEFVSDGVNEVALVNRIIIDARLKIPKELNEALSNCVEGNQNLITKL